MFFAACLLRGARVSAHALYCLSFGLALMLAVPSKAQDRPNIIHIFADDLGYGSLGFTGNTNILTPNLDALAGNGMVFNNAYAATLCAPSRAMLMTGFHNGHTLMDRNGSANIGVGFRDGDVTVAEMLQPAGYTNGVMGKWGFGGSGGQQTSGDKTQDLRRNPSVSQPATLPNNQGFDEFYGYLNHSRAHRYFISSLWETDASAPNGVTQRLTGNDNGTNTNQFAANTHDLIGDEGERFIRNHAGDSEPFYLQMNYTIPHNDLDWIREVPDGHAVYEDENWTGLQKDYAAMITRMDDNVGELINALSEEGVLDNTLIIFTSDNGATPVLGGSSNFDGSRPGSGSNNHPVNFHEANGPFTGGKRDLTEGGIHVPMFAYWIDENGVSRLAGSETDYVTDLADFMPTVAALSGQRAPVGVDGVSILPTLLGEGEQRERGAIVFEHHEGNSGLPGIPGGSADWTIIHEDMKLTKYTQNGNARYEMYNLQTDPTETTNLLAGNPSQATLDLSGDLRALALAEGVERNDSYAVQYMAWTGGDGDSLSDASNWTGTTTGTPDERWSAVLANTAPTDSTVSSGSLTSLGFEVRGDQGQQTLRIQSGSTLNGRNEVRVSEGGRIHLDNATLRSNRWTDVLPQGELTGQGNVAGDLYNAGTVAPGLPADLNNANANLAAAAAIPVNTGVVNAITFDFTGIQDDAPLTQTSTLNENLEIVAGLNFGPGTSPRHAGGTGSTNDGDEFNIQGWNTDSHADAITSDDYIGFTVRPVAGVAIALNRVSFDLWRNGDGAPENYAIHTSLDGFTTSDELAQFSTEDTGSNNAFVFAADYTGGQSTSGDLAVRLYAWDPDSDGGNAGNTHLTGVSLEASFFSIPTTPLAPAGWLALDGNYTQFDTGHLMIDLAGTQSDEDHTEFDQLIVNGVARLDGKLSFQVVDGYTPQPGDTFEFLVADSIEGQFSEVVADLGSGLDVVLQYDDGRVIATVQQAIPEPGTAGLLGLSASVLLMRRH